MHTTIAFGQTGDVVAAAWANVAAVPDAHIKTEGDYIYVGEFNKILGFFALPGTTGEQIRLFTPSIRRVNPYYIPFFETAVLHAGVFETPVFYPNIGLSLVPGEGLEAEIYITLAEVETILVFLASVVPSPVAGNIHTLRFSTDPVRSASNWSYAEITLLDPLPVGSYDVVGCRLETGTGVGFRLVPLGGSHRPGGVPVKDEEDNDPPLQRYGGLGVWMSFTHGQTPGIELICSATAAKETIYGFLDIIPR